MCSFLETLLVVSSEPAAEAASSTSTQVSDFGSDIFPEYLSGFQAGSPAGFNQEIGNPLFGVKDLELLHFYTLITCFTVSNIPEWQLLWQQVVPRIAFTHHFLLHGIMAFSALHFARVQPERKNSLHAEASAHHDIGLRLFRTAMLDLRPQNCDACFAYSSILVVYTWASSDQAGDLFFSDKSIDGERLAVGWSSLLRGVQTLLTEAGEWTTRDFIKLILYPWAMDLELAMQANPEVTMKLASLSSLWDSSPAKFSAAEVAAFNETLALLHEANGLVISSTSQCPVDVMSVTMAWPIRVPETFLPMVTALKPEALVVLAHYSLLLNQVDQVWFMHGMSRHLLRTIQSKIGK